MTKLNFKSHAKQGLKATLLFALLCLVVANVTALIAGIEAVGATWLEMNTFIFIVDIVLSLVVLIGNYIYVTLYNKKHSK